MIRINKYLILLAYLGIAFLFYYQVLGVYFLSDDLTQIRIMNTFGMGGITHNFDIAFIRPLPYIFMAGLHHLFGHQSAMPYHTWNIIVHALNSYLVYILYIQWMKQLDKNLPNIQLQGLVAGILFLTLPYQAEAVTWVAATVDLMVTTFIIVTLIFYLKYKAANSKKYLYRSVLAFGGALMCKEACLFIPVLIFTMECFDSRTSRNYLKPFAITSIYLAWLPIYIIMRYYFLGELIGGYHEAHTVFSPPLIVLNASLYTAKFFAFYRLLPGELKDVFKIIIYNKAILTTCIVVLSALIIYFRKKIKQFILNTPILLLLIAFYVSLIPVINLETSFIGDSQTDRYGYVPAIFFVMLLVYVLNAVLKSKMLPVLASGLMLWFYMNIQAIHTNWKNGSYISESIIKNFNMPEETAYILNLPDNYNGTYMLRTGFVDGVLLLNNKVQYKKIKILSYHPINATTDVVAVSRLGENTVEVQLQSPGNRFYFMEKLFVNNPNSKTYAYLDYTTTSFVVQLKTLKKGDVVYYYSEGKLHTVNI